MATALAVAALMVVLGLAVLRPRGLSEAVAAVPAALLLVVLGVTLAGFAVAEPLGVHPAWVAAGAAARAAGPGTASPGTADPCAGFPDRVAEPHLLLHSGPPGITIGPAGPVPPAPAGRQSRRDATAPQRTSPPGYGYRPALDGIRALAVGAVLTFHAGVAALPGGFLGVDAFFVLSGFLITSLLLAERAGTGKIRLRRFWVRRARRLLPALLLVLVGTVVAAHFWANPGDLGPLRGDALSALAYVANWRMIYRGSDYFTQTSAPSALQHTWSLGIEEQFYLLWPLIVVALLALLWHRRRAAGGGHRADGRHGTGEGIRTARAVHPAWPGTAAVAPAATGAAQTSAAPTSATRDGEPTTGGDATLYSGQRARRRFRRATYTLVGLCVAGAVASALAQAWLYRPTDVNRSYFGTDTRAVALLIGCALAGVLAAGPGRPTLARPDRRFHPVLGAAALLGAAVVGWLWTHASGSDGWLYRGGMVAGALGVAAVIAHAVRSPASPTARLLALAPLVFLGRISYGLYLWHWPLFQFVDAERTGLRGPALLAVRLALTLAISVASFYLVEEPIRHGRALPRGSGWAPVATAGAATLAVLATLVATVPPVTSRVSANSQLVLLSPTGTPPPAAPMSRPGRRPGALPRITFFGDSVSWSLGTYLPATPGLAVTVRSIQGCGIARLPDIRYLDVGHTNYPGCTTWDRRWIRGVNADDPDVAVILLDRWELMDRRLNGVYQHVGDPAYDVYLSTELDRAVTVAGSRGARVVLLTAPYTHRAERPDGGLYPEDTAARVDAWNNLLRAEAAAHSRQVEVLDLNSRVCPDGKFTWDIGGLQIRSDGLHFTPAGVQRWIAPWLLPRLQAIALGRTAQPGPSASPSTGISPAPGVAAPTK